MAAMRRCHGFAAVVGEPSIVSALGAASRGASRTPIAKPMTDGDQAERGGLEREHGGDLARREADGLQQPDLAVLRAGAGADEDRHDREDHDEQQDRVGRQDDRDRLRVAQRLLALVLPGLDGRGAGGKDAAARAANAGAAAAFVRRIAWVQCPAAAIGLDPLQRGARDPGQARVAARVARLARQDRRAEDGQLDRPAGSRDPERRPTSSPTASAKLRSSTMPSSRSAEPAVRTGALTRGRAGSPASSTRSVPPRRATLASAIGTGSPRSATPGSAAIARASACDGTFASTCAPLAAVNVRCQGSRAVAPTSSARTIVAAAALESRIVSALASRRERMPANASLTSVAVMSVRRARREARPGARPAARSRRTPAHRAA